MELCEGRLLENSLKLMSSKMRPTSRTSGVSSIPTWGRPMTTVESMKMMRVIISMMNVVYLTVGQWVWGFPVEVLLWLKSRLRRPRACVGVCGRRREDQ